MYRVAALVAVIFLCPFFLSAQVDPNANLGSLNVKVTCYAPGAGGRIEGPFATSRPAPNGGGSKPKTLDDFRLGTSKFVTLAANPMHYGKWFNMGSVSYVSNLDGRQYTISNVVGYVHDTGCAFMGAGQRFGNVNSCCQKYNTCGDSFRKFDVAYGDYRQGGNVGLVNSTKFCANKEATWTQIGGPLTTPPTVSGGDYVGGHQAPPSSSLFPTYTQPPYSPPPPQAPPPPQYSQPPSGTQPSQYFNSAYTPVPPNQPFPATTGAPSTQGGTTLGQSLLDLLKPITNVVSPVKPITISVGTSSIGSISNSPPSGTQITVVPLGSPGTYNPSQTFTQTYLETPRASAVRDTASFGRMLETLNGALLRILEILRLR